MAVAPQPLQVVRERAYYSAQRLYKRAHTLTIADDEPPPPPLLRHATRHWFTMTPLALLPLLTGPVSAWAHSHERRLAREGRPLSPAERALARQLGVVEVERVRLAVVERIPFPCSGALEALARWTGLPGPAATHGLTLGHAIYLRADAAHSPELLAHECRHVHQCEQLGSLRAFMQRYLREVARHGYHDAPLEQDARRAARAWRLAQGAAPPAFSA